MISMRYYSELATPIGPVTIVSDGTAITAITMRPAAAVIARGGEWIEDDERLAEARAQLAAYFAGRLRQFSLPLAARGSAFQMQVWAALQQIPFGATTSYGALAAALGHPGSARAVGAANRTNPIGIVVPCHRVIGANGTLTGYAGGIERKQFLLDHEAALAGSQRQMELEISKRG
jgi:methylated-DNA-[protein]-cysteine S-methyltransferase